MVATAQPHAATAAQYLIHWRTPSGRIAIYSRLTVERAADIIVGIMAVTALTGQPQQLAIVDHDGHRLTWDEAMERFGLV
jgi:hypothetical protein